MTTRIQPIDKESATPQQQQLWSGIESAMGVVPNIFSTMLHSPVVTESYLTTSQLLAKGKLSPQLRESLALTIGETNNCEYCVSAHVFLGSKAGLSSEEVSAARRGTANDPRTNAILQFAQNAVESRGQVTQEAIETLRGHGVSDEEIVEIIAHIGMNIFTNYFNHIAATDIDFPVAEKLATCGC